MRAAWPCTKDCPRRAEGCHNREICPEWGEYENHYKAERAAAAAAGNAWRDFSSVRRGARKRSEDRRRIDERKKAAARRAAES